MAGGGHGVKKNHGGDGKSRGGEEDSSAEIQSTDCSHFADEDVCVIPRRCLLLMAEQELST